MYEALSEATNTWKPDCQWPFGEKNHKDSVRSFSEPLSPVRFRRGNRKIAAFPRDFH